MGTHTGNDFKWKRVWIVLFLFLKPLKEARSLFSPHRFRWGRVIAFRVRTMTPQRDLDCSLVSLPLSSRLDAHPGGMWFVSRYKTSPLRSYITSTSHKGLARRRRMLVLVQLSPGSSSADSMQLETDPAAPESYVCTGTRSLISLMCGYKHSQEPIPSLCRPPAQM